jgi:hypothetical protein
MVEHSIKVGQELYGQWVRIASCNVVSSPSLHSHDSIQTLPTLPTLPTLLTLLTLQEDLGWYKARVQEVYKSRGDDSDTEQDAERFHSDVRIKVPQCGGVPRHTLNCIAAQLIPIPRSHPPTPPTTTTVYVQ